MKNLKLILNVFLFYTILSLMVASCRSSQFKVSRTFSKYPKESEKECVSRYPVIPEYVTVKEFIPGDTIYIPGPFIDCDSIMKSFKSNTDTVYIKKLSRIPCPPIKYVHDTVKISEKAIIEDTRKLDTMSLALSASENKVSNLKYEIYKIKKTRDRLWAIIVVSSLILIMFIYLKIVR